MIRGDGQAWAYDPEWLCKEALQPERLAALLMDLGGAGPVSILPLPWWWFSLPQHVRDIRRTHGITRLASVVWSRSRPSVDFLLMVHRPTGQWMDCLSGETGMDFLRLVELRLALTPAKAAWRLARLMGFERPVPPA
jgi:hypothetical protein